MHGGNRSGLLSTEVDLYGPNFYGSGCLNPKTNRTIFYRVGFTLVDLISQNAISQIVLDLIVGRSSKKLWAQAQPDSFINKAQNSNRNAT